MKVSLVLTFDQKLDCNKCDDVLLKVYNPLKLAVNSGVIDPGLYKYIFRADLIDIILIGSSTWQYTFSYDDSVLLDPSTLLTECDIQKVCCSGCILDYLVPCVVDSATIDFQITDDGCITGFVLLSSDVGNIIETRADGLYAISAGGDICVTDSLSIDFSIDDGGCVTGDVILSSDEGNELEIRENGLYAPTGGGGGDDWHILGNSGTVDGTNFLGTTDNIAFDIRTNNQRCFRIIPGTNPSLIGGKSTNSLTNPSAAGIFSGLGHSIVDDVSHDFFAAFIGGGYNNEIDYGQCSTIVGGFANTIDGTATFALGDGVFAGTIGGGDGNSIIAINVVSKGVYCDETTIAGGVGNTIIGSAQSTIGGGDGNTIDGSFGGAEYDFSTGSEGNTIAGGSNNTITTTNTATLNVKYDCNSIMGGFSNQLIDGQYSSILGGSSLILGAYSVGYQSFNEAEDVIPYTDLTAFASLAYFGNVDTWIGNTDNSARKLKFFEPNTALDYVATNYSSFEAQTQAGDIEYILPAALPTAGQFLKADTVVGNVVTLIWA